MSPSENGPVDIAPTDVNAEHAEAWATPEIKDVEFKNTNFNPLPNVLDGIALGS